MRMIARRHRWFLCAASDAGLCTLLGLLLQLPILHAIAPLSIPLWAWIDAQAEGRALTDRPFGG
jgi:hypothetical protein